MWGSGGSRGRGGGAVGGDGLRLGQQDRDPVEPTLPFEQPFEQPFTVSGGRLRLYGPAVWLQPDRNDPNLFCEPEQPSDYAWRLTGRTLTLAAVQKTCADRDTVMVGSWTRTGR